ncbi:MAG: hypothetical protein QXI39_07215 [Candidatus Bathyarchaeia archaeon]
MKTDPTEVRRRAIDEGGLTHPRDRPSGWKGSYNHNRLPIGPYDRFRDNFFKGLIYFILDAWDSHMEECWLRRT